MESATLMLLGFILSRSPPQSKSRIESRFGRAFGSSGSLLCYSFLSLMAPKKTPVAKPRATAAPEPPRNREKKPRRGLALGRGTNPARVQAILEKLDETYPDVTCALVHANPFQ